MYSNSVLFAFCTRRGGGSRWQWAVFSYSDRAFLRDGQVVGDCEKAELPARAAIAAMSGVVDIPKQDCAHPGENERALV